MRRNKLAPREAETLFEKYCAQRGYAVNKLATSKSIGRSSDYTVQMPGGRVICEVRDFVPGDREDRATKPPLASSLMGEGSGGVVRRKLQEAKEQMAQYAGTPCTVILYGYDDLDWPKLGEAEISTGMFGEAVVRYSGYGAPNRPTHAQGRELCAATGDFISAVCVLRHTVRLVAAAVHQAMRLDIYHNPFALVQMNPLFLPHRDDKHWVKNPVTPAMHLGWTEWRLREEDRPPKEPA